MDHYQAARALTVAGVDIYHPTQERLTGVEISFCGDVARSLKKDNYFVLETQAQGFPQWLPYDGQLRLQAYSHLASGANMVEYWHWHSIHNSFETYWKGLLSHDFKENDTYRAAKEIGKEFAAVGSRLVNLKKHNKAAILLSNESLTALQWFPIGGEGNPDYNDVVRYLYDQLYKLNVECDVIWPESENLEEYGLILIPALYAAREGLLERIDAYVKGGGHILATFKTAFANENLKVYADSQPHGVDQCLGVSYSHFTHPEKVKLASEVYQCTDNQVVHFMELVNPDTAQTLASYDHYNWKRYAAVTRNRYGKGSATYLGCFTSDAYLREILSDTLKKAGIWNREQEVEFPVVIKKGINDFGKEVIYFLNYSKDPQEIVYWGGEARDLFTGRKVHEGEAIDIGAWSLVAVLGFGGKRGSEISPDRHDARRHGDGAFRPPGRLGMPYRGI